MLFYILLIVAFLGVPVTVGVCLYVDSKTKYPEPGFAALSGLMIGIIFCIPSAITVLSAWTSHASDISKVVAQEHRIEVQQERIDSLSERLNTFDYPEKPMVSLDADTPWASIVESLTDAENQLARAKDERAIAIRSIEARKRGPMSGVVTFVGDY